MSKILSPGDFDLPDLTGFIELKRKIATGTMVEVFLAEDIRSGARCVVRFPHESILRDRISFAKFVQLTRINIIDSPYTVPFLGVSVLDSQRLGVVMAYAAGGDLENYLDTHGLLTEKELVALLVDVFRSLKAFHDAGVIHRNIKLKKIVRMTADGDYRLISSGIARTDDGPKLDELGGVVGTLDYVAPEYMLHAKVDHRTDIYGIGIAAFRCLTGRRPFQGKSVYETMTARFKSLAPRPSSFIPNVSDSFDQLIGTLLQPKPEERFQTCEEVLQCMQDRFLS